MFDFLRQKIPASVWMKRMPPVSGAAAVLIEEFDKIGEDISRFMPDRTYLAIREGANLQEIEFGKLEVYVETIEKLTMAAGIPRDDTALNLARKNYEKAVSPAKSAIGYLKTYYKDAWGGPGERALLETGLAKKMAQKRLNQSARLFLEEAETASDRIRTAFKLIESVNHKYESITYEDVKASWSE